MTFRDWSLVCCATGLQSLDHNPELLHIFFVFQHFRDTSARYWVSLCSWLMAEMGNISIKAFLRRFKGSVNLPINLTISMFPLLARKNRYFLWKKKLCAPLTNWGLNVSLKYLTPPGADRSSQSKSPLCIFDLDGGWDVQTDRICFAGKFVRL